MSNQRSWLWGVVGAFAAVAVTLGLVALLGSDTGSTPASGEPPASSSPTVSDSPTESPTEATPPPATFTVAAYYVVPKEGSTPRLYREFTRADGPDVATAAVRAALAGGHDPDYTSPWSEIEMGLNSVTGDSSLVTIDLHVADLSALQGPPAGVSPEEAALGIEQLMRTAQGALKVGRAPVQFLVDGKHVSEIFGEPTAEPLANQDDADVLAHVWVNTPLDGANVKAGDKVEGLANSFEASVTWRLLQGETVVQEGFTTAEEAFKMAPYSFELPDLPPGDYTLVVSEDDPSGGTEGPGPDVDTKALTFS